MSTKDGGTGKKYNGNSGGSFFPLNKKGQEMSTNTIILIILGLIVLVILILGFTMGWDKFVPFLSTNNVDNVKTACALACSTGSDFDFCSVEREVKDGSGTEVKDDCNDLATLDDQGEKYFGKNYGIEECSTITCAAPSA